MAFAAGSGATNRWPRRPHDIRLQSDSVYWPWMNSDGLYLHNTGQNVAFADGHSKWYSKSDGERGALS